MEDYSPDPTGGATHPRPVGDHGAMADLRPSREVGPDGNRAEGAELVEVLIELGVDPARASEYVERGDPQGAVFDVVLMADRLERTLSAADIVSRGGLGVEETAAIMHAFGLPLSAADEPAFTPEEAHVLVELRRLEELWPAEVRIQVGRAYGAMLAGIARAELQAFQLHTERIVLEQGGDAAARLVALKLALERLLPLADPLLVGMHRRWIEHELGQRAISTVERGRPERLPGAVEVAFLFCDLKGFTAYAEAEGDEAAISAIERFFDVIARERGEGGDFVKSLGDGAMLVYQDSLEAVEAGLRVIAGMRAPGLPGVHAAVHRGVAIARSGDYFGGTVNLAARLLALGARDELVATDVVVRACRELSWEPLGEFLLRGVTEPVVVHRLAPRP